MTFLLKGLVLLSMVLCLSASETERRFQEAGAAYQQKDFPAAAATWEELVEEGYGGFELYYNCGNAFFRAGEVGEAILYWERARSLEPADRNVLANLELARSQLQDRFEESLRLPFWDVMDRALALLPGDLPAWLFLLLLLPLSLLLAWQLHRLNRRGEALSGGVLLIAALPVLAATLLLLVQDKRQHDENRVVILQAKLSCHAAPSHGAKTLFDLHEGSTLKMLREAMGPEGNLWLELELPDARRGWCLAEMAGRIKMERKREAP